MPHKDKNVYNSYMNEYMKKRWKKRREKAVDFLGGKCVKCSTKENLEFDHIERHTKIMSIAEACSASEKIFWVEVQKCQLLCTSCHIEKCRIDGTYAKIRAVG